jgi:hypothetical protein
MKHLLTIRKIAIMTGFFVSSLILSEAHMSAKVSEEGLKDKELYLYTEWIHEVETRIEEGFGKIREVNTRIKEGFGKIHEVNTRIEEESGKIREVKPRIKEVSGKIREVNTRIGAEREKIYEEKTRSLKKNIAAINDVLTREEYKLEVEPTVFSVGDSASIAINNEFGNIQILEGEDHKVTFKVTITGRGKNREDAKKSAESVAINIGYTGGTLTAKTVYGKIRCNNCGRSTDFTVYVPKQGTRLTLDNQYGDIKINHTVLPSFNVKLQFGKFYANEITDAELHIQYGGATINKCKNLKLTSSFSKYKLGEIGTFAGSISYDDVAVDELGDGNLKSEFSDLTVGTLKNSLIAKKFSYGGLKITNVADHFSTIDVNAEFSKIQVARIKNHHFKATLYTKFGKIKTGQIVFNEETLIKDDVVIGTVGTGNTQKNPPATVNISNSYGNIVLQ